MNTTLGGDRVNRQLAFELLSCSKPKLQARFGVIRLALFGSIARDTATGGSDVNVLGGLRRDRPTANDPIAGDVRWL